MAFLGNTTALRLRGGGKGSSSDKVDEGLLRYEKEKKGGGRGKEGGKERREEGKEKKEEKKKESRARKRRRRMTEGEAR